MSNKVLTPKCIKCGSGTLNGEHRKTTLETRNRLSSQSIKEIHYVICLECKNTHGTVIRVWRRYGKPDLAYFSKERNDGVKIPDGVVT